GAVCPCNKVPAVVRGQVDAISLMVSGDYQPCAVEDRILAQVLFIYPQYVRRASGVTLQMIVKLKPVDAAQVPRLAHAQDHALQVAVEPAKQVMRRNLKKVPRANCVLDRRQQSILADALRAAKHQCMVDLFFWALHAMRQPIDNVASTAAKNSS